jgi:hypothetical protein
VNPLRKPKNEEMPQGHNATKVRKAWLSSAINLVKLRNFLTLWQKTLFGVGSLLICDESALVGSSNANYLNPNNFHHATTLD